MYKWKKVLSFILAVALLSAAGSVSAAMNEDDSFAGRIQASAFELNEDGFIYSDCGSYIEIKGYDGDNSEVVIPNEIDGKPVTRIAKNAFDDSEKYGFLEVVTLPDTLEYIGANAFRGCVNVKEGYIPSKFIGICAAAREIEVSDNVTELVNFQVIDANVTKVTTEDGLASLYTEYKIDGTYLADRGLAVPEEVTEADVSDLTADSFKRFVDKYSTIEKVTLYNRSCAISDGLIPESAVISGWRNSSANVYATQNKRTFVPLDGLAPDEDILNEVNVLMAYRDADTTSRFLFNVNADAKDYYIYAAGVVVDKNNVLNENTANAELLIGDDRFVVGKGKANSNIATIRVSENGKGLWVRPYVKVDNGSGDESQAVIKYGDAVYVYSEDHVKNKVGITMETSETTDPSKVRCDVAVTNGDYQLESTGVIVDKTGTVKDEASAREMLTLDSDFNGKIVTAKAKTNYAANVSDTGNGVWVVGYTTVSINGYEVTKYTDPVFWAAKDKFSDVSVDIESSPVSAIKFKLSASAKAGDLNVLETGIITNKTGAFRNAETASSDAAAALRLDSDFAAKQQFNVEESLCEVAMTDIGNGIWYVGYVTVEADGETRTIYSEPKYVYSDVQVEGVAMNMSVSQMTSTKFRFDLISRSSEDEIIQSGVVVNKTGAVNESNAKQQLVLGSALSSNIVTVKKGENVTSYAASVTDVGNGIWCVGYVIAKDSNGKETTYYTEPVYIHDANDVAKANVSISMVDTPTETAGKYRFDVTSITGDCVPKKMGVIVNRDGTVNETNAKSLLVLGSSIESKLTITTKENTNTYAANVSDKGKGIWIVGYVVVNINGEDFVKYTEPVNIAKS